MSSAEVDIFWRLALKTLSSPESAIGCSRSERRKRKPPEDVYRCTWRKSSEEFLSSRPQYFRPEAQNYSNDTGRKSLKNYKKYSLFQNFWPNFKENFHLDKYWRVRYRAHLSSSKIWSSLSPRNHLFIYSWWLSRVLLALFGHR